MHHKCHAPKACVFAVNKPFPLSLDHAQPRALSQTALWLIAADEAQRKTVQQLSVVNTLISCKLAGGHAVSNRTTIIAMRFRRSLLDEVKREPRGPTHAATLNLHISRLSRRTDPISINRASVCVQKGSPHNSAASFDRLMRLSSTGAPTMGASASRTINHYRRPNLLSAGEHRDGARWRGWQGLREDL